MSSDSLNHGQRGKNSKKDIDDTKKNSKTKIPASLSQAGTSKSFQADRKKWKKQDEWGFFPQGMWFWKQEEPQQDVQIKKFSSTSLHSMHGEKEIPQSHSQQQPVIKTTSQYIWPGTFNVLEPQRLVNQPTLDQLIEKRKLRENQLIYAEDFNKHVDYLGDKLSKTKLNILIAQLNNILPSSSEENMDSTHRLTRSKPLRASPSQQQQLHREAPKVPERLTPEEIAQREQLRQNQLQEYEEFRDQINLLEGRSSLTSYNTSNITSKENNEHVMDETISKTDLNKLIELLREPTEKTDKPLQELIKSKPQILEVIKETFKKTVDRLTPKETAQPTQLRQTQKFPNLHDQVAILEDRSVSMTLSSVQQMRTLKK